MATVSFGSLEQALRAVKRPGHNVTPPPQAAAFPGSGRYKLVQQELETTTDNFQEIAARTGVTLKEVRQIAAREGIYREEVQNRVTYNRDNRIRLTDMVFEKIEEMVPDVEDPQDLQRIVSSLAQMIDKRRLEDGEVTSRVETVTPDDARASLKQKLDDLAERQAAGRRIIDAQAEPVEDEPPPYVPHHQAAASPEPEEITLLYADEEADEYERGQEAVS